MAYWFSPGIFRSKIVVGCNKLWGVISRECIRNTKPSTEVVHPLRKPWAWVDRKPMESNCWQNLSQFCSDLFRSSSFYDPIFFPNSNCPFGFSRRETRVLFGIVRFWNGGVNFLSIKTKLFICLPKPPFLLVFFALFLFVPTNQESFSQNVTTGQHPTTVITPHTDTDPRILNIIWNPAIVVRSTLQLDGHKTTWTRHSGPPPWRFCNPSLPPMVVRDNWTSKQWFSENEFRFHFCFLNSGFFSLSVFEFSKNWTVVVQFTL